MEALCIIIGPSHQAKFTRGLLDPNIMMMPRVSNGPAGLLVCHVLDLSRAVAPQQPPQRAHSAFPPPFHTHSSIEEMSWFIFSKWSFSSSTIFALQGAYHRIETKIPIIARPFNRAMRHACGKEDQIPCIHRHRHRDFFPKRRA